MTKKICLIIPDSPFLLDARVFPFIGILKIASAFEKQGAKVDVLDLSGIKNWDDVIKDYFSSNKDFEFIGITATTPQMPMAFDIGSLIKSISPDSKLVLGGTHATLMHTASKLEKKNKIFNGRSKQNVDKLMELFDVLVCGDGELLLEEIKKVDKGIIDADDRQSPYFLTDDVFSKLPPPARHLIDLNSYNYTIEGHKATSLIAQLGCPFRCISGEERVATENGLIKIKDLCSTEEKTATPLSLKVSSEGEAAVTSHALNQGVQPTIKIVHSGIMNFYCHPEHRIRIARDGKFIWELAGNIKDTDLLPIQVGSYCYPEKNVELPFFQYCKKEGNNGNSGSFKHRRCTIPTNLNEDLAWIMGFLIGDGSIGDSGLTFAVDSTLEEKLRQKVKKLFNIDIKVYKIKSTNKIKQAWIYSVEILQFFISTLNFDKANKHRVSELIYKSPKSVIESFIEGLWDADAYKKQNYLVTAYENLAREVANLLIYTGNSTSIHKFVNKKTNRTHFRVKITKSPYIPCNFQVYHAKNKIGIRKTLFENRFRLRREVLEKVDPKNELLKDRVYYTNIESIQKVDSEVLYDLTVPKKENYISSGIISHNCTFCSGRNSPSLRAIRNRSVESIISEVKFLHQEYGYTGFMFYDDELNVSKSMIQLMKELTKLQKDLKTEFRLRGFIKAELFNEAQAEAMKEAGFRWLLCGFESGDERILKNIEKQATKEDNSEVIRIAKKFGLKTKALMSVGHAGESLESIQNTKNWLIENKPEDFDCTVITTYPGSPYYDMALPTAEDSKIYVYTHPKSKDKLYQVTLDYTKECDYYKGVPGHYTSFVYTDYLTTEQLVAARDDLENSVRETLNIPFNPVGSYKQYEHSMGQGNILPDWILRSSAIDSENRPTILEKPRRALKVIQ